MKGGRLASGAGQTCRPLGPERGVMTYHAKVIAGGKIVIPADLRRELGIVDGDTLVIDRDETGGVSIRTREQIVREAQRRFREMVGPDYSVEQFLAERQAEWGEG